MSAKPALSASVKKAMTSAKDHYDNHLAHFYDWMIGDFKEKQRSQQEFFIRNKISPTNNTLAIDLGAGHGLQSISLAKLGFEVIAVDFNKQLLDTLTSNKGGLPIETVIEDANNFMTNFDKRAQTIVCMGDTITHLQTIGHVKQLLEKISEHLEPQGKVVISFRELMTELRGDERFIPVRNDDARILTCFLEYFPDHVVVHDILHERQSGKWIQQVSSYPKLRMSEEYITNLLEHNSIKPISTERIGGMVYIVGQKII